MPVVGVAERQKDNGSSECCRSQVHALLHRLREADYKQTRVFVARARTASQTAMSAPETNRVSTEGWRMFRGAIASGQTSRELTVCTVIGIEGATGFSETRLCYAFSKADEPARREQWTTNAKSSTNTRWWPPPTLCRVVSVHDRSGRDGSSLPTSGQVKSGSHPLVKVVKTNDSTSLTAH
ncbi:unnamed protein product [Protopolystoma xenopodis]|uniref:Uncharacterized protein n=1 Tax=Protopolystoma xenopodis TaxID=117903 RepID=A0A448XGH8_9PLAT|nr:unnamed protein product [Protopolystoma xenopodis]